MSIFLKIKKTLKRLIAWHFYFSGVWRVKVERMKEDDCLILSYHRVLPLLQARNSIEAGMYVTPNSFRRHLKILKCFFHVLPLREVTKSTCSNKHTGKPKCFITFDDGWYDLYKYAFPIIAEFNVPVTAFIPINYIGSHRWFWSDVIYQALTRKKMGHKLRGEIKVPLAASLLSGAVNSEKEIQARINQIKNLHPKDIESIVKEITRLLNLKERSVERLFIDQSEMSFMKTSGLVEFGSHTVNHYVLTSLRQNEIASEVKDSYNYLREKKFVGNGDFYPFCYPNGNYNDEIENIVKTTGYDAAVTTMRGWNKVNENLLRLRRVSLHEDMSGSTSLFIYKLFH